MDKDESDFLVLKELVERAKADPAQVGWYLQKAFQLGKGCSVDAALAFPPRVNLQLVPHCGAKTTE